MSILIKKTFADFTSENPILLPGQTGQEIDRPLNLKLGDGLTPYNDLLYAPMKVDRDPTMAADSDERTVTQKAIRDYVAGSIPSTPTLAQVLAAGNSTGTNDIVMSGGHTRKITQTDGSYVMSVQFLQTYLDLSTYDGTHVSGISINGNEIKINAGATFPGLQENSDYSANYTAASLIRKSYADGRYAPIGSGVTSFNTRTGAVTLTSGDVTTALGYTPENVANKATDFSTINNTLYPTVQAVNNAITTAVTGLLDYRGTYDASGNAFPSSGGSGTAGAILKGDFWIISTGGTLGGTPVTNGDLVIAMVDSPGSTSSNWDLVEHDIIAAALTKTDDTNVTLTLGGSPSTALLAATSLTLGWTGTLGVARGGTNIASYAVGDLLYASGSTTLSKLADVAAGSYLRSGGVTTAPVWSTTTLPNSATTGDLMYASGTNAYSNLAAVATGYLLGSGGVSTAPSWLQAATLNTSLTTPLLIGGTGTTSSLTLKATSGVGITGSDIIIQGGNNGASEYMRFLAGGTITQTATGGTITTSGSYTVHTFTSGGTFTPAQAMSVEYLVVAGGGGGGGSLASDGEGAGGGGAGGMLTGSLAVTATPYTITIGSGGSGGSSSGGNGTAGSNSVFSSITATGGGYGTGSHQSAAGGDGGSGGGTSAFWNANGGTGTPGQGNNGAKGQTTSHYAGGGGGGAGSAGSVGSDNGGSGGSGTASSISGASVAYAGGGGGGAGDNSNTGGAGGSGGGGSGGNTNSAGNNGTANTGGGGGGGSFLSVVGGNGGSGIVIIRYLTNITNPWAIGVGLTSPTAIMDIVGSTTSQSGFRMRAGTAPTSPNDGDIWYDGMNFKIRVGSTTKTFTLT